LLACTCDESDEELWGLSIGQRDLRLFELRRRLFGPELGLVARCPSCHDALESTVGVDELCGGGTIPRAAAGTLTVDGQRLTFRVPTCLDVARAALAPSPRETLLDACVTRVEGPTGSDVPVSALTDQARQALAHHLAELDPHADIEIDMSCPGCAHGWAESFDIASYLFREVQAWAHRALHDVHALARAYGWSEAETLRLSPLRRRIYLELCGS
jgi:hypothetical protein